jgi:hypothetical protein
VHAAKSPSHLPPAAMPPDDMSPVAQSLPRPSPPR